MKKIFIYAYMNTNLGDDLFIEMLCDRYPDTEFYTVTRSRTFKNIKNLKTIPTVPLLDGAFNRLGLNIGINSMLSRFISNFCDGIVNIGGSIFIQPENWQKKTKEFKKSILKNKPFFVIGSNFGSYSSQEYYFEFKSLFKKTTDICFRDEYSYNLFSDLKNVRKASDIVFSYTPKIEIEVKKNIVISVIQLSDRKNLKKYKENYKEHIVELIRKFIKKGYIITMMGFCKNQGDEQAINEINQMLEKKEKKYVESYIYTGDLEEALKVIQKSSFVLGSRFHAMILAWIFNKPVYPIIYSDKSLNVIEDIDFEGVFSKIESLEKVNIDEVVKSLNENNSIDIKKQVSSASNQFKKLDEFLY